MKHIRFKSFLIACLLLLGSNYMYADRIQGKTASPGGGFRTAEACTPPSASAQLDINNVRCMLYNGGDMWWDLVGNPRYEIPKGSGKHSMFAASLWIGGLDAADQMRVAAQTYRQDGYDFWPGPLNQNKAEVDNVVCSNWNKMFVITKAEIDDFRADFAAGTVNFAKYPAIQDWPAKGSTYDKDIDGDAIDVAIFNGEEVYAAPFVDVDGNALEYNPANGDYPEIKGDQAVFWIINDKGNVHTATGGQPIGIEMHILAFAFTTANAINNMTFYDQLVINRSSTVLKNTYMGQWVDADLGFYMDDFVGCDTVRGLGYVWNSDNDDNLPNGYGSAPPAIGVDFFKGPIADYRDGVDNDKDGNVDNMEIDPVTGDTTWGEELIIMSKFVYYNNDFSLKGNPETATHYYNYLRGIWKDGTPMVDNGRDAYPGTASGTPTNYIFPGSVCNQEGWIEGPGFAGTAASDRRFLQSAGPFTLQPGAVNEIITGVVWARGSSNTNSVCELLIADDVAQALFDNDFNLLEGPDAPLVEVGEYDKAVVLTWRYLPTDNNFNESYVQADPVLKARQIADSLFTFQGFLVYQLSDSTVGLNDLTNTEKARLVAQCDVVDNVGTIKNVATQNVDGVEIINETIMVRGENKGIFHSVKITKNLFATNEFTNLANYTPYYFAVVAYAYNDVTSDGRSFVLGNGKYARARKVCLPHPNDFENGGQVLNSAYGSGIPITQIGGFGNGGQFVKLSAETEAIIINNYAATSMEFEPGAAPINVRVVNPELLKNINYKLIISNQLVDSITIYKNTDPTPGAPAFIKDYVWSDWALYDANNMATPIYQSKYFLRNNGTPARPSPLSGTEQVIPEHGIAISVTDVPSAFTADQGDMPGGGVIGSSITHSDENQAWLTGLADDDTEANGVWNWILAGFKNTDANSGPIVGTENVYFPAVGVADYQSSFEKLVGRTWAPFCFARPFSNASGSGSEPRPGIRIGNVRLTSQLSAAEALGLDKLADIELVLTPDESKWTRCVVVETASNTTLGAGSWLLSGKWKANVNKKGEPETSGPQAENHGLGWFPGYAIDVNTGRRLCVFFGESEFDKLNRGNDMIFNPTASFGPLLDRVGGRHYIYVTDLPYTGENGGGLDTLKYYLLNGTNQNSDGTLASESLTIGPAGEEVFLGDLYKHVMWTSIAMTNFGYDIAKPQDMPSEAHVSIRINQPFKTASLNGGVDVLPTFTFNTSKLAPAINQTAVADSALDMIRVVPNPYYAFSTYESGQLESLVKITNLPKECTISIYSLNGQIVKTFRKNSQSPEQRWDLKNEQGVPVASGVYLVHVNVPNVGEKVVKMLAVMRQLDLNGY